MYCWTRFMRSSAFQCMLIEYRTKAKCTTHHVVGDQLFDKWNAILAKKLLFSSDYSWWYLMEHRQESANERCQREVTGLWVWRGRLIRLRWHTWESDSCGVPSSFLVAVLLGDRNSYRMMVLVYCCHQLQLS